MPPINGLNGSYFIFLNRDAHAKLTLVNKSAASPKINPAKKVETMVIALMLGIIEIVKLVC